MFSDQPNQSIVSGFPGVSSGAARSPCPNPVTIQSDMYKWKEMNDWLIRSTPPLSSTEQSLYSLSNSESILGQMSPSVDHYGILRTELSSSWLLIRRSEHPSLSSTCQLSVRLSQSDRRELTKSLLRAPITVIAREIEMNSAMSGAEDHFIEVLTEPLSQSQSY